MFIKSYLGSFYCTDSKITVADAFNTKINAIKNQMDYGVPVEINAKKNCYYDSYVVYEVGNDGIAYMDYIVLIPAVEPAFNASVKEVGEVISCGMKLFTAIASNRFEKAGGCVHPFELEASYSVYDIIKNGNERILPPMIRSEILADYTEEDILDACASLISGQELLDMAAKLKIQPRYFLNTDRIRSSMFTENCLHICDTPTRAGVISNGVAFYGFVKGVKVFKASETVIITTDSKKYKDIQNDFDELLECFN